MKYNISILAALAALLTSCVQVTVGYSGPAGARQRTPASFGSSPMRQQMPAASAQPTRPVSTSFGQPQGRPQMAGSFSRQGGSQQQSGARKTPPQCPKCHHPLLPVNGQKPTRCSNCGLDLRAAFASRRSGGGCSSASSGFSSAGVRSSGSYSGGSCPSSARIGFFYGDGRTSAERASTRAEARSDVRDFREGVRNERQDFWGDYRESGTRPTQSEVQNFQSGLRDEASQFRSGMRSQYGSPGPGVRGPGGFRGPPRR